MAYSNMQNSFLAGELSPDISARVNIEAYAAGAAEIYNCIVDYRGGVLNRAGTQWVFVAPTDNSGFPSKDPADWTPRLVPFIYEDEQALVLVFTVDKIYFMSNGAPVLEPLLDIDDISNANPGEVEFDFASGPSAIETGDFVFLSGIGGMTELNNRYFIADDVQPDSFLLKDIYDGANINTTSYGAYTSGGIIRKVHSAGHLYAAGLLWSLKFIQIRDTLIVVSPYYPPAVLTRVTPSTWLLVNITFASSTAAPTGVTASASFTGSGTDYTYVITATDDETGVESPPSAEEEINKDYWPNNNDSIRVEWNTVTGAAFYTIYCAAVTPNRANPGNAMKGLLGQTRGLKYDDFQAAPNFAITPPKEKNPFNATGKYPSCVTFIQQRVAYAGTINRPYKAWLTPVGDFTSMARSQPPRDTDALVFELASTRADPIKNLLAMTGGMLTFTSEAVYHVYGGADGAPITPNNINSDPVSRFGAGDIAPIAVGFHVLYTQNDNSIIRDLQYNFFAASYESTDITILASHFFKDMNIMRWAYSNQPWKVLWAVRDDGKLLSLTYVPEQNIFAFALHETQGFVKDVCVIPEGDEDVLYLAVCRVYTNTEGLAPTNSILSSRMATIERMRSRVVNEIEDAWFLDDALNSTLSPSVAAIEISAATGNVEINAYAGGNPFSGSVVGQIVRAGGGMLRIVTKNSDNRVQAEVLRPITDLLPNGLPQLQGAGNWYKNSNFSTFTGLWHLEGQEVWALADGGVQGPFTVEDGAITLTTPASYVVAGLKYQSRLKTLRPELQTQAGTSQNKRKNIPAVTLRMAQTRGIKIGPNYVEMDTWNPRVVQPLGQPPPMVTGDEYVVISGTWNEEGQVYIKQDQPLPMQILGLIPEIEIGDT